MIITNTTHEIRKPNDVVKGTGGTGSITVSSFTGGSTTVPASSTTATTPTATSITGNDPSGSYNVGGNLRITFSSIPSSVAVGQEYRILETMAGGATEYDARGTVTGIDTSPSNVDHIAFRIDTVTVPNTGIGGSFAVFLITTTPESTTRDTISSVIPIANYKGRIKLEEGNSITVPATAFVFL